jgi:hypothetical protein
MKTAMAQALLMALAVQVTLAGVSKASNSVGNIIPNHFIIEVDTLSRISTKRTVTRVSFRTSLLNFSFEWIVSGSVT